jgi:hypothetical protein
MKLDDIKNKQTLAEHIVKKFAKLKADRTNWDSYWEEIAEYILPRKDNVYGNVVAGEKKHNRLYDSTSIHSNELLASALHSMLTNPTDVWFALSTGEKDLDKNTEVRQYLQDCVKIITQTLNTSNFQTQIHETYLDLGSIGTSVLRMEEDDDMLIRFFSNPIYGSYVEENSRGDIDTVYRCYDYTLRQIEQEFGDEVFDAFPDLKRTYEKEPLYKCEIVHAVEPRNGKWASIHVLKKQEYVLRDADFNENPHAVPRWSKISGEKYGRSPGMKALSDIKMLNQMMKTLIRVAQKVADPPLMVPDNGFLMPLKTVPGGTNIYRAGTKDRIEPLQTNARLDIGAELLEQTRVRVRQAFFIDQLQLQDGPQMTATEVNQRIEEQLRIMGPILGRLNNELLKPIIDRTYAILFRKNKLPDAPDLLKGKELEIQYTSQIAKAQKAAGANTLNRVIQSVGPLIEMNPTVMDVFNSDEAVRIHADIFGLPEEMLNNQDDVKAVRQARAEQQQAQIDAERENVEADTAQKVNNL